MMRGVALVPHGLVQLSVAQGSEVCLYTTIMPSTPPRKHILM